MNFLNNGRILIFLFKLLDELWDDYNAIFYLLNNLGDSIVSVFFRFYLYFLWLSILIYYCIIYLFII